MWDLLGWLADLLLAVFHFRDNTRGRPHPPRQRRPTQKP